MFNTYIAQKKTKRARKKRSKIIMRYIEQQIREACKRGEYSVILNKVFKIYDYFYLEQYRLNELDDECIKTLLKKGYTFSSVDHERKIKISWENEKTL